MKKLVIPVVIAVLAGVGGGSGFAYMGASKAYMADSTQHADSLAKHPDASHESTSDDAATKTATEPDHALADSTAQAPSSHDTPTTPADSLREAASHTPLQTATKDLHDASPAAVAAGASPSHDTPAPSPKTDGGVKPNASTTTAASIVREARNEAIATSLPEQRLAKIFAAMSAKDAAKVLEQMPDADVRAIVSLMNDRSAAAVLSQLGAARAASITKGAARAPGATP